MSLYSLATDLFADIDKARAGPRNRSGGARLPQRLADDQREQARDPKEVELPHLRGRGQNNSAKQTPTLELLEGCLRDIQQIRSGAAARWQPRKEDDVNNRLDKSGQESFGRPVVSDQDRESPSRSETSDTSAPRSWRRHAIDNGSAEDEATGVAAVTAVKKGGNQAHTDQFAGKKSTGGVPLSCRYEATINSGEENRMEVGAAATIVSISGSETCASQAHGPSPQLLPADEVSAMEKAEADGDSMDAAAARSFADFEREIEQWSMSTETKTSRHAYTDFAAHLSAKYLCGTLDPMPSSAIVCRLRRETARRIDLLATTDSPVTDGAKGGQATNKVVGEHAPQFKFDAMLSSNGYDKTRCRDDVSPALVKERAKAKSTGNRVILRGGPSTTQVDTVDAGKTLAGRVGEAGKIEHDVFGVLDGRTASVTGDSSNEALRVSSDDFRALSNPARGAATDVGNTEAARTVGRVSQFPLVRDRNDPSRNIAILQARAVRFLLEEDSGDRHTRLVGGGGRCTTRAKGAQPTSVVQEVDHGKIGLFWPCPVCKKKTEGGQVACTTCGRRQDRNIDETDLSNTTALNSSNITSCEKHKKQEQPDNVQEKLRQLSIGDSVRSGAQARVSGSRSERDIARNIMKSNRAAYDTSCFAKMRQTTEPAVKARLSLTGEIKSLLSAIRSGS